MDVLELTSEETIMEKRALLVGIDSYDNGSNLGGCVEDATRICRLLEQHDDGSANYECRLLTTSGSKKVTRALLRHEWYQLFNDFTGDVLFYFAGHGKADEIGGYICAQDATPNEQGISVHDLLHRANHSRAREIILVLDTCYGFYPGRSPRLRDAIIESPMQLREGITILGAASPSGLAIEIQGRGVFTTLLAEALAGAAADIRGYVTIASAYSYAEQLLGAWDQRPIFQSNVNRFLPIRRCKAAISDSALKELIVFFPKPNSRFRLDPSFESKHSSATKKNIGILKKFRMYRDARLLRTVKGDHLCASALQSNYVELTPTGRFYWRLAKTKRI